MTLRPSISRFARSAGPDLSRIGAQGGAGAALSAFLADLSETTIADAQAAQAEQVSTDAYAQGAALGQQAAADGVAPSLPADDTTIRNKALKQGAMAGWMARFDVDTQAKAETWAAEHADNPDAFRAKWQGLTTGTVAMMPPELRPQVQAELDKRGGKVLAHLQAAKTRADQQKIETDFNANILQAQVLADRNSENAWRQGNAAEAEGYDATWLEYLNSRTDLDARQKVVERQKFADQRQRAAALGEFDRVKARGLSTAEAFIRDFRQPGRHPQLDPDAVESIAAEMERHTADLREQQRQAVAELRDHARDAIFRAESGYGTANLDGLAAKARALGATDLAATLADVGRNARLISDLAKMPLPALQQRVAEYDATARTSPDDTAARRAELAKGVLANTVKAIRTDPLAHFAAQGADVPAIDWDKPETLQARAQAAEFLSGVNRFQVPVLTKSDADDLAARIDQAGYEDRARLLGNLYRGFGVRRLPEVLDTIGQKAPEAAQAGALMARGKDGERVARDILFGAELRKSVGSKDSPGGRQYMPPKDDAFVREFQRELPPEAVAGMDPENLRGLQSAILSAYVARSHAAGAASQATVDGTTFRKAVADVTGGVLEFNGKPVIAPVRGMRQDALDDLMQSLTDADLGGAQSADGHPVTAQQVRKYGTLRMVEPGRYAVQIGDQFVTTADHRPAVLNLGAKAGGR